MEQKFESYGYLLKSIRDAVRKEAQKIPKFRDEGNGCIRVTFCPCCPDADEWLGGLSEWTQAYGGAWLSNKKDIVEYEHVFTITHGGSHTMVGDWGNGPEKVNCYGYSALKVAHCSLARKRGVALKSGVDLGDKDLTEDNGWSAHYGAICLEIKKKHDKEWRDYCRIYVCVSGADQLEDLQCAKAAIGEVKKYFYAKDYGKGVWLVAGPRFAEEHDMKHCDEAESSDGSIRADE